MNVSGIFREQYPALYRYLVRLSGDEEIAADAAQEAFARMVERPPTDEYPRAWLFKVATNAVRESCRTSSRRLRILRESPGRTPVADSAPDPHAVLEAAERKRAVERALNTLSSRDRMILLMREEGFSHREIADAAGVSRASVGTLVSRALEKLASELALDREDL